MTKTRFTMDNTEGYSAADLLELNEFYDAARDAAGCNEYDNKSQCDHIAEQVCASDGVNFMHDIGGIGRHLHRETGKLCGNFRPRFSAS